MRPGLAKDQTVIVDAGIATKENIDYFKANNFHDIVVNRGKGDFEVTNADKMQIVSILVKNRSGKLMLC